MAEVTLLPGGGFAAGEGEVSGSLSLATNIGVPVGDYTFELEPFAQTDLRTSVSLGSTFNFAVDHPSSTSIAGLYLGGNLPSKPNIFWGLAYTHEFDLKKLIIAPQITLDFSHQAQETSCNESGIFAGDLTNGGCEERPLPKLSPGNHIISGGGFTVGNSLSTIFGIPINDKLALEIAPGVSVTYGDPASAYFIFSGTFVVAL